MSPDHKADQVRRLLDTPHPPVPPELLAQAVARGTRLMHRDRVLRRVLWTLLVCAAVAFSVWAARTEPWAVPPSTTTPPFDGW
ncbi:hypothetical protein ABT160_23935 [Streptomyces sp. NPDC001941]|uniref:hypothetical protein n=1 Tax=Streptomyces sp. NPDC001941 TaxID=3154659 RepID=UPI00331AA04D